jgi:hypothetical protein
MADYALAVDVGAEVTAAISDDEGPRVIPIGDADQLSMPRDRGRGRPIAGGQRSR